MTTSPLHGSSSGTPTSTFTKTEHPRAEAGTAHGGQFVAKARTEADVALTSPDLQVPADVSDGCRATLAVLAPMGLRGTVVEEMPRDDGWTYFTVHNGEDELRIGAHWTATSEVASRVRHTPERGDVFLDSVSVDLTNPCGEPDHAGGQTFIYAGGLFDADAQAAVRKVVLSAAMQEAAGRRWPALAGVDVGPHHPLTVGSEPERRFWKRASDPEPAQVPGARYERDDDAWTVKVIDGELAVEIDGVGAVDNRYLERIVYADIAGTLGMDATGHDAAAALRNWLVDAHKAAYDSPVFHRFFG